MNASSILNLFIRTTTSGRSSVLNIKAIADGEKTANEAIKDITVETAKTAGESYLTAGLLAGIAGVAGLIAAASTNPIGWAVLAWAAAIGAGYVLASIFTGLIVIVAAVVFMGSKFFNQKDLKVPDVSGKTEKEAVEIIQDAGFEVTDSAVEISDDTVEEDDAGQSCRNFL